MGHLFRRTITPLKRSVPDLLRHRTLQLLQGLVSLYDRFHESSGPKYREYENIMNILIDYYIWIQRTDCDQNSIIIHDNNSTNLQLRLHVVTVRSKDVLSPVYERSRLYHGRSVKCLPVAGVRGQGVACLPGFAGVCEQKIHNLFNSRDHSSVNINTFRATLTS